jgi:cytochrome c oxidase subunit 2
MSGYFTLYLPQAADTAARFDALFFSVLALTGTVALGIAAVIVYFGLRYRHGSRADRAAPPVRNPVVEAIWIALPLALFLGIFAWGAVIYAGYYQGPADAMPVYIVGKQWMWKLQHANGRREINELHLPLGRPVRLVLTTQDVIHSFFVPAFRIKQDAVPGRYTTLYFTPSRLGEFRLHCAEYCGTDHAAMGGRVIVMPPAEFERWLAQGNAGASMAARGFEAFRKYGCSGCHDPRSTVHAPDLRGLYGRVVHLQDGRTVVADEAYIRDSILLPARDVVAGFDPVMPSFAGQIAEDEILDVIAWLKQPGKELP